jgi:hypothetical protein
LRTVPQSIMPLPLGVMFVLSSALCLSHTVLIPLSHRSDWTYRHSSHSTWRGASQIQSPISCRGRKLVEMDCPVFSSDHVFSELIDTVNLQVVLVSPRRRAHDTFHYLTGHLPQSPNHVFTENVREWDYGDYEGLKPHEIRAIQPTWSIWKDGLVLMPLNQLID